MQVRTEEIFCRLEGRDDLEAFKPNAPSAFRSAAAPTEEMADAVVWLALDAPDYITAERLNITGGLDKD